MRTTTTFFSGGSQAVRIPKEFRFDSKKVVIERRGCELILKPLPDTPAWPEGYFESFGPGAADESFFRHPQGEETKRTSL
jgi:virulence-associated protein VagC